MRKNKKILIGFILASIFLLTIVPTNLTMTVLGTNYSVPEYLEEGDLMFMDLKPGYGWKNDLKGYSNDHVAIYLGDDTFGEVDHSGVHSSSYGSFFTGYQNFTYWSVDTTEEIKEDAISFVLQREENDSGYQYWTQSYRKIADPAVNDSWYCSELVWAAYYEGSSHQVDIDQNDWSCFPWLVPAVCMGLPLITYANEIKTDGLVTEY